MTHLLVDARNCIYRAVYSVRADHSGQNYHFFTALLRKLTNIMNAVRPTAVHIFWDAPRETVWRRAVLPTYKDRSDSNYVDGLAEDLAITTAVAKDFFKVMGCRQYQRKEMEADDLIYAAVSIMHPQSTVIVSSDSDMTQITYRFNSCSVFQPADMTIVAGASHNPAHLKALMGDETDSIKGYYGIGPKRGQALLANPTMLTEFLAIKGADTYYRNLLLIDLGMCPRILANTIYVQKRLAEPVTFDQAAIMELVKKHKVNGLYQNFANLALPFKTLTKHGQCSS